MEVKIVGQEKLYLDTSVASAYFDNRSPYRMQITRIFWHTAVTEYQLVVSEVTLAEIKATD